MQYAAPATETDNPAGRQRPAGAWRRRPLIATKLAMSAGLLAWVLTDKVDIADAGRRIARARRPGSPSPSPDAWCPT